MPAKILDGKQIATEMRARLRNRIQDWVQSGHRSPELAVIWVGSDPASTLYVRNKRSACLDIGIISHAFTFDASVKTDRLIQLIQELNQNPNIDGILVQLPLPPSINTEILLESIHPDKDIDGFHPYNLGKLAQQKPLMRPCTPAGIIEMLERTAIPLSGLQATVVGVSNIVGRPMILELLMKGCTVTACHRLTRNLKQSVSEADLLVSATGNPHLIKGDWIKEGAIVVDVGINALGSGQFVGDVEFESAQQRAAWITPVPGGVGPMTVAFLLQNTLTAYEKHIGIGEKTCS